MVMTSSGLHHWIPSERANPRRNAEFLFREGGVFFLKNMKIAVTGPFSQEYYITEETGEKCVLHIFFSVYVAFLLFVREQGPTDIIQFIILSHC